MLFTRQLSVNNLACARKRLCLIFSLNLVVRVHKSTIRTETTFQFNEVQWMGGNRTTIKKRCDNLLFVCFPLPPDLKIDQALVILHNTLSQHNVSILYLSDYCYKVRGC